MRAEVARWQDADHPRGLRHTVEIRFGRLSLVLVWSRWHPGARVQAIAAMSRIAIESRAT